MFGRGNNPQNEMFLSRTVRAILPAILAAALFVPQAFLIAQTPVAHDVAKTVAVAPEHPITIDQLRILVQQQRAIEPMKQLTMEEAERQRKTLPPWFPSAVWDDVEKKIMAIDIPVAILPAYQRYLSQENADALILFYQGPLGGQIAEHFIQREAASARSGTSGAATTAHALEETSQSSDVDLGAKRMNELSPDDRKRVLAAVQAVSSTWKPISDEMAESYDNLVNSVIQKEIAAHNKELLIAQQTYLRKSTPPNPAPH
jgi:hypothetical protein